MRRGTHPATFCRFGAVAPNTYVQTWAAGHGQRTTENSRLQAWKIWRTVKPMNVIGIVSLSLLCGLFLALLIGGLATLLWLAVKLRREVSQMTAAMQTLIAGNHAEMKSSIESAKASFSSIRTEMKTVLDTHNKSTRSMLEEHRKQMKEGIDKINAEALIGASARAVQACQRLENAAGIIQKLFLDANDVPTGRGYAPEETAPENTTFGGPPSAFSLSQTSAMDAEVEQAEMEQNQQTVLFQAEA